MPARLISAPASGEEHLSPREAAQLIRVTPKTLSNWRALNIGPRYTKLSPGRGGRIRYSRSAIAEFLSVREGEVA
ncbi:MULTISPECIES: helix-turn-helix domain-containing protein [Streptomyces]|nr:MULTISPECIES: helix-turn-helix domain-containing protein [Streptomyces]KUJ64244.1 hypothetical protein ACZ90_59420 [Streptomyces albus subsp. albus]